MVDISVCGTPYCPLIALAGVIAFIRFGPYDVSVQVLEIAPILAFLLLLYTQICKSARYKSTSQGGVGSRNARQGLRCSLAGLAASAIPFKSASPVRLCSLLRHEQSCRIRGRCSPASLRHVAMIGGDICVTRTFGVASSTDAGSATTRGTFVGPSFLNISA